MVVGFYADADFAGLWGHEDPQDPICARIITGFMVTFENCPLLWVSKLQTDTAIYAHHSEYVALYHSVRAFLPLKIHIKEVIDNLVIDSDKLKFLSRSTIYEDNNRAICVATIPRMTPTSKHIAVKYRWFRQHVGKEFVIQKIESENQKADIFTKGLLGQIFVRIHKLLCGW